MPFVSILRMRPWVILMIAVLSVAVSGCATTYNSGIQEKAPGAYFLSIRLPSDEGGSAEAKRQALAQADVFCSRTMKISKVTSEELGPVTADIYFICVDSIEP